MQPELRMLRRRRGRNQDEGDRSEKRSSKAPPKLVSGIDASTESLVNRDSVPSIGKQRPHQLIFTFTFHKTRPHSSFLLGWILLRYQCIKMLCSTSEILSMFTVLVRHLITAYKRPRKSIISRTYAPIVARVCALASGVPSLFPSNWRWNGDPSTRQLGVYCSPCDSDAML